MRTVNQLLEEKGREVIAIGPDAPVLEAIRRMAEHGIGALLVMRGAELAGIVSERDYARKVILMGRSSAETAVHEIMSRSVSTVGPTDSVDHCMRLMTDGRFRHLPVVEEGQVVGVLSIGDLVKAVIADQQHEIAQLQQYIAG
jgi:CBS domain-containing protein